MLTAIAFALVLSAVAGDAPAATGRVPQVADRLSEPSEQRSNAAQPPAVVMDLLGIRRGFVIGEVGAGRGRVTVHLADRVGAAGRVYANDIDTDALAYLRGRCRRLGLSNVEFVQGLPDDARFPENTLDLAFTAWVYHHVDNRVALLKSLLPSLKPWGAVAMVEPTPATTEPGLRPLTRESVEAEARAAGFRLEAVLEGRLKQDNVFVLRPLAVDTADSHDAAKVRALWLEYLAWKKTAAGGGSVRDWAVHLERRGVAAREVRRRFELVRAQFTEQPEGIEMIFDSSFGKPLTGDAVKDGFKTAPNAFLVEAAATLKAGGQALDVGAGMGRNAMHLGALGWNVTGIDLSEEGLKVLRSNATKAGLKIDTVRTSYQDYDFGRARWDLVAMILSWAPIEDPAFLSRVKAAIKPGGYFMFEHATQRTENPFPPGVHAPAPGALRDLFKDFEILVYREVEDFGDWGGPPCGHVRMLARKRAAAAAAEPRTPPPPAPEMQRLSRSIVGTFTVVETHHARPGGGSPEWTATGTATYRPGPDGMSVVEDYRSTGPQGAFSAVAVIWWDAAAGAFRHFQCESGEPCGVVEDKGTWQDRAVVFVRDIERQGRKIRLEERYDFSRPDAIVITAAYSMDGAQPVTGMTITYTRDR